MRKNVLSFANFYWHMALALWWCILYAITPKWIHARWVYAVKSYQELGMARYILDRIDA